jgi:hypothetical protein
VAALHILAPEEIAPPASGRVRLVDSESGETVDRFIGEEEIRKYRDLLAAHCEECKKWCRDHGMAYVRFGSQDPWDQVVTVMLREAGILE